MARKSTKNDPTLGGLISFPKDKKTNAGKLPRETKAQRAANGGIGKANPDTIVTNIHDNTGAHVVVTSAAGATISYPRYGDDKQRRQLSAVGGSLKALQADLKTRPPVKPQARLAHGVDSHNAPHSAKAVSDQKRSNTKGKAEKTAPKAGKNKQPSRGAERSYTVLGKANAAKADSWRHHMTAIIIGTKDTASAKAAHAKSRKFPGNKLDFNWAANNGFIKFS